MRRGHGSTKVPGVKLRPAAPNRSNKSDTSLKQPAWSRSTITDDVDSTEILKACKKPFIGVVLCASGINDKANIFRQAVELGAQTSSDLTDRVTHLLCENPGSAKYNYSVEHGIPILLPSWISDAYGKWLAGESIDVAKSMGVHRFPVFKNVKLCLTAIDDVQKRKEIRRQLEKNGGIFVDKLGKDSQLTHLLCGPDRGEGGGGNGITPKMQFVVKTNMSSTEKVHLVWEDWFWDCLQFRGILSEKDYLATGPRPQRKIVREPSPLLAPIASSAEQNRLATSRTNSVTDKNADVEEVANIKRVPEATARLWESMLRKRGFEVKDGKLERSPSKIRTSAAPAGDSPRSPSPMASNASKDRAASSRAESSLSAAFKRTKSFAVKETNASNSSSSLQGVRSTSATNLKGSSSSVVASSSIPNAKNVALPDGEKNLFAGLRFCALGEAKGPKLTEALELRGGTVLTGPEDQIDYVIVRLVGGNEFYFNERDESQRAKFRTECWVEQCIFEERICAVDDHPAFVPLKIPTPIPDADKLVVHVSGLTPSEKTPSVRLIKAIGATVTDQLSRRNTHLICPCGSGPKFNKAQEWRTPVLNLQWLYSIAKTGTIQDTNDYLVGSQPLVINTSGVGMMTDITNSEFVQGSSKGKTPNKGSDRSQSSNSSSAAVFPTHTDGEPNFSDSWIPNALLSESAPEHPPTSSPAPSSRSPGTGPTTPASVQRPTTKEAGLSKTSSGSPFTSPSKHQKNEERVPSSATPSPLKLPPSKTSSSNEREKTSSSRSLAPAPTKVVPVPAPAPSSTSTLSGESTSNLKDAIASLLGKRPSSDDNDSQDQARNSGSGPVSGSGSGSVSGQTTRASKRSKPPPRTRSKIDGESSGSRAFSRTTSNETLNFGLGLGLGLGLGRTGSGGGTSSNYPLEFDFSLSSGEVGNAGNGNSLESQTGLMDMGSGADEDMRVTYEDPSQRAEERRLLNLISGNAVDTEMDTGADGGAGRETIAGGESQEGGKHSQPKPRRRGRNLVRRVSTKVGEQC